MTDEEIKQKFKETYPEYMYGDTPLSPYFDIWCYAIEIMEEQIDKMKCCNNCKHYHWSNGEDWCNDHYGQPMYDEECKDKWELKE